MALLEKDGNWTEDGKQVAIKFEEVLKPVFLNLLDEGQDHTESYSIATKAVFNAWMAASYEKQNAEGRLGTTPEG
jgi:hypothetical protein